MTQEQFGFHIKNSGSIFNSNIANFADSQNHFIDRKMQTDFSQTSGSTHELLQIVANMRLAVAQFCPEIADDIMIDIDDVEAEIQKPEEERNLPKLRKRLIALLTAASVAAVPIAGMTDFAHNVMEIGDKLGIELIRN